MDVGELLGLPCKIRGGRGFGLGEHSLVSSGKALADVGDLGRGLRQSSKFRTGGQGVSDQQQPAFFRTISRCGAVKQAKGTGVGESDVFDPVVWLGVGSE